MVTQGMLVAANARFYPKAEALLKQLMIERGMEYRKVQPPPGYNERRQTEASAVRNDDREITQGAGHPGGVRPFFSGGLSELAPAITASRRAISLERQSLRASVQLRGVDVAL